MFTVSYTY